MAAKLRATTASPRFAYVFWTNALICAMASSGGRMPGELEEARLHDGIDPAAHPGLVGDGEGVDHPEVDLLVDEQALDVAGQVVPDLVRVRTER